jgi:hypothetical protein
VIASASAIGIDSDRPGVDHLPPGKNGNGHKPNNGSTVSEKQVTSEEGGVGNNGLANRRSDAKVPGGAPGDSADMPTTAPRRAPE